MTQSGERELGPVPGERRVGDSIIVDRPLEQSVLDYPEAILTWVEHLGGVMRKRPLETDPSTSATEVEERRMAILERNNRQFVEWLRKQWQEVNQAIEGLPFNHVDMRGNQWIVTTVRRSLVSEGQHLPEVSVGRVKEHNNRSESVVVTFGFDKNARSTLKSVRVYKAVSPNASDSASRSFSDQRSSADYAITLGGLDGKVGIKWRKNQQGRFSFSVPMVAPAAS